MFDLIWSNFYNWYIWQNDNNFWQKVAHVNFYDSEFITEYRYYNFFRVWLERGNI